MGADIGVADLFEASTQTGFDGGAILRREGRHPAGFHPEQNIRQSHRLGKSTIEKLPRITPGDPIGVIAGFGAEKGEAEAGSGANERQRTLGDAHRCPPAGAVRIEAQDRLGHEPPEQTHLVLGQRRAKGRHGMLDADPGQSDHIHVAFDHHDRAQPAGRLGGEGEAVEEPALVKNLGLGGVEVLWLGVAEAPPAEACDPAASVRDRKHHPVAEAGVGRSAGVVAADQQPGRDHGLVGEAVAPQRCPQPAARPRHSRGGSGRSARRPAHVNGRRPAPRDRPATAGRLRSVASPPC